MLGWSKRRTAKSLDLFSKARADSQEQEPLWVVNQDGSIAVYICRSCLGVFAADKLRPAPHELCLRCDPSEDAFMGKPTEGEG